MHEPILMYSDVDESTEVCDIRHRSFEHHAGPQIFDIMDSFGECRGFELRAGITAGFFELKQDVAYGWQAEALIGKLRWIKRFQSCHVAHERADITARGCDDFPGEPIGLRMDRGGVKRLGSVGDPQEARAKLKCFWAEAGDA